MRILITLIVLGLLFKSYSILRTIPSSKIFKKAFFLSDMRSFHAIRAYVAVLKDTQNDSELGDMGLYKLPDISPTKSGEERTTGILIQVKSPGFDYASPFSVVQDINDSTRSKLFTIYIVPLLLLVPLTLAMGDQESIYSITTRHEIFPIPGRFFMVLIMVFYIFFMWYIFGKKYSTQRVTMENRQFEEKLDVYGLDGVATRVVLTPERIEVLNNYFETLKDKSHTAHWKTQSLFFSGDSLYIYATMVSKRHIKYISFGSTAITLYTDEIREVVKKLHIISSDDYNYE